MLSYAGVYLNVATPELAAAIEAKISPRDVFDFQRLEWPGATRSDWTWPGLTQYRPIKISTLYWPRDAMRFAVGYFLCTQDRLAQIRTQVYGGSADTYVAKPLVMSKYDQGGSLVGQITADMWMLPARPLFQQLGPGPWQDYHLLTLVDDRYHWWNRNTDSLTVTEGMTTWADMYSLLGGAIGTTVDVETVNAKYLTPNKGLTAQYEPACMLLDVVAYNVGQRIVRLLDGTVKAEGVLTAQSEVTTNLAEVRNKIAGGLLSLAPGQPNDTAGVLPEAVTVTFPKTIDGELQDAPYAVTATLASLALSDFSGANTNDTTKTFHDTNVATVIVSGSPTNATALTDLTKQIATDWYRYQTCNVDVVLSGIFNWIPEGWTDHIEWVYLLGMESTRIQRGPWNDLADTLFHGRTGTAGELCNGLTPDGITITAVIPNGCGIYVEAELRKSPCGTVIASSSHTFHLPTTNTVILQASSGFIEGNYLVEFVELTWPCGVEVDRWCVRNPAPNCGGDCPSSSSSSTDCDLDLRPCFQIQGMPLNADGECSPGCSVTTCFSLNLKFDDLVECYGLYTGAVTICSSEYAVTLRLQNTSPKFQVLLVSPGASTAVIYEGETQDDLSLVPSDDLNCDWQSFLELMDNCCDCPPPIPCWGIYGIMAEDAGCNECTTITDCIQLPLYVDSDDHCATFWKGSFSICSTTFDVYFSVVRDEATGHFIVSVVIKDGSTNEAVYSDEFEDYPTGAVTLSKESGAEADCAWPTTITVEPNCCNSSSSSSSSGPAPTCYSLPHGMTGTTGEFNDCDCTTGCLELSLVSGDSGSTTLKYDGQFTINCVTGDVLYTVNMVVYKTPGDNWVATVWLYNSSEGTFTQYTGSMPLGWTAGDDVRVNRVLTGEDTDCHWPSSLTWKANCCSSSSSSSAGDCGACSAIENWYIGRHEAVTNGLCTGCEVFHTDTCLSQVGPCLWTAGAGFLCLNEGVGDFGVALEQLDDTTWEIRYYRLVDDVNVIVYRAYNVTTPPCGCIDFERVLPASSSGDVCNNLPDSLVACPFTPSNCCGGLGGCGVSRSLKLAASIACAAPGNDACPNAHTAIVNLTFNDDDGVWYANGVDIGVAVLDFTFYCIDAEAGGNCTSFRLDTAKVSGCIALNPLDLANNPPWPDNFLAPFPDDPNGGCSCSPEYWQFNFQNGVFTGDPGSLCCGHAAAGCTLVVRIYRPE